MICKALKEFMIKYRVRDGSLNCNADYSNHISADGHHQCSRNECPLKHYMIDNNLSNKGAACVDAYRLVEKKMVKLNKIEEIMK